jgi:hypothetical protein
VLVKIAEWKHRKQVVSVGVDKGLGWINGKNMESAILALKVF